MTPSIRLFVAPVAILFATLAGCGGSDSVTTEVRETNVISPAVGGAATSSDGKVALAFPAGAVQSSIKVSIAPTTTSDANVLAGSAYEFGPDGTQFAQPVTLSLAYDAGALPTGASRSSLRIARRVGTEWVALEEGLAIDSASGRVRGSIRSFSSYAVSSDPCIARDAQLTRPLTGDFAQSFGQLDALTCLYSPGRRAVVLRVGSTRRLYGDRSGTGTVSIKQATGNARTGRVFVTFNKTESAKFLIIAPNTPIELVAVGDSGSVTNSYKIVHDTASNNAGSPGTFSCNDFTPLIFPGASIDDGIIAAAFACQYAVKFSPFPSAIGKPLLTRLFLLPVEAGKSYRVTTDGFSPASFDATLTLFRSGAVIAQDVVTSSANTTRSRTATFTATTSGNILIELASGQSTPTGGWINPLGTYRLSVTGL